MSCANNPYDAMQKGAEPARPVQYTPPTQPMPRMTPMQPMQPPMPGMPGMMPPPSAMPPRTPPPTPGFPPPLADQTPTTVQSQYYLPGYLTQFIGREMRVEFLIGTTGPLVDRIGTLLEVGASYIVLRPIRTNDLLTCDLFAIKFVNIYGSDNNLSTAF